jgi:hypothetical protein
MIRRNFSMNPQSGLKIRPFREVTFWTSVFCLWGRTHIREGVESLIVREKIFYILYFL